MKNINERMPIQINIVKIHGIDATSKKIRKKINEKIMRSATEGELIENIHNIQDYLEKLGISNNLTYDLIQTAENKTHGKHPINVVLNINEMKKRSIYLGGLFEKKSIYGRVSWDENNILGKGIHSSLSYDIPFNGRSVAQLIMKMPLNASPRAWLKMHYSSKSAGIKSEIDSHQKSISLSTLKFSPTINYESGVRLVSRYIVDKMTITDKAYQAEVFHSLNGIRHFKRLMLNYNIHGKIALPQSTAPNLNLHLNNIWSIPISKNLLLKWETSLGWAKSLSNVPLQRLDRLHLGDRHPPVGLTRCYSGDTEHNSEMKYGFTLQLYFTNLIKTLHPFIYCSHGQLDSLNADLHSVHLDSASTYGLGVSIPFRANSTLQLSYNRRLTPSPHKIESFSFMYKV